MMTRTTLGSVLLSMFSLICITCSAAQLNANFTNQVGCNGVVTFTAAQAGYTSYIWTFGDNTTATGQTVTHNYTAQGNYTVMLSVLNAPDSDSHYATVYVGQFITQQLNGPADVCAGTTATYLLSNASANLQYNWLVSGGNLLTNQHADSAQISFSTPGPAVASVIIDNGAGCDSILKQNITVHIEPQLTVPGHSVDTQQVSFGVCQNTAVWYHVLSNTTGNITWSSPGGNMLSAQGVDSMLFVFANAGTTIIQIVETTLWGCTDTVVATVNVSANPVVTVAALDACLGSDNVFVATADPPGSALTYQWLFDDGGHATGTNATHIFTTSGQHSGEVIVINSNGCVDTASATTSVDVHPGPPVSCVGPVCAGAQEVYSTTVVAGASYHWTITGGTITSGGGLSDNTVGVTWGNGAMGTVSLYETGPGTYCQVATTVNVPLVGGALAIQGPAAPCRYSVVTYATDIIPGGVYTWALTSGTIISGQGTNQIQAEFYNTTPATVSVTINHQILSCVSNASLAVTPSSPFAVYGQATACAGVAATFNTYTAGSFSWTVTGGIIVSGNGTNSVQVLWNSAGNYNVKATSATGFCNTEANINVNVINRKQETVTGSAVTCANSTETYSVSPSEYTYAWSVIHGAGTIVGSANSNSVVVNWGTAGIDSLMVIYTNTNYCADTAFIQVAAAPQGVPAITGDTLVCYGTATNYSFTPVTGVAYTWETAGGVITSGQGTPNVSIMWIGNQSGILRLRNTGCNTFRQVNVVIRPTPPAHIDTFNLNCTGTSAGLKVVEDYPGYNWSTGANTQAITITTAGVYNVTVTDSKGCTATATKNAIPIPNLGFSNANIIVSSPVFPYPYPYLILFATGSPVPTSYLWSTGNTEATQYAAVTGIYSVTMTNQYGCTATESVDVTATTTVCQGGGGICTGGGTLLPCPGISPVYTTNSPVCNPVQFTPGVTATYYLWNFGDGVYSSLANPTHRFSSAGIKTIILNYSNDGSNWYQCSQNLTINSVMNIDFTSAGVCNGATTLTNISTSALPVTSVLWAFGDGVTSSTTPVVNHTYPNTAPNYLATLTLSDGVCTDSKQKNVSTNQLVANFTYADVCVNNPALFNDATVHSNLISGYSWNFGNGETEDYNDPVTYFLTTSNYTVNLTVTDANGCSSTSTQSVPVNQFGTLPVTAGGPLTFCRGSSVDLTLPAGYAIYWNTGDTGRTINVTQSGMYFAFAKDAVTGCSGFSDTVTAVVNIPPTAFIGNPSGTTTFCTGTAFSLNAMPYSGVTYQWYFNNAAYSTNSSLNFYYPGVGQTGSYQLVITDAHACKDTSAITQITVNPLPGYTPITQSPTGTLCSGQPVTLSIAGSDLYQWSNGTYGNNTTVYAGGNYSVVITNSFGCASNSYTYVNMSPSPDFTYFPTGCYQICQNSNITVTGPAGMQTYLWSNGANTASITLSSSGIYSLSATAANGCSSQSGSFSVDVFGSTNLNLGNDTTICAGQPLVLQSGGYPTIQWQDGSSNSTFNVVDSGLYYVKVTTSQGCVFADSIHVNIDTLLVNIGSDTILCSSPGLPLGVTGVYSSIIWQDGSTGAGYTVTQSGTYYVNVTDASGCKAGDTMHVTIVSADVNLGNDTVICAGSPLVLRVNGTFTGITWQDGTTSPVYTVIDSGLYYVHVTTNQGCSLSDTIHVNVDTLLVNLGNDTMVCNSINLPLSVAGNFASVLWQDGSTANTFTVTGAGLYYVSITDANGCKAADSLRVTSLAASVNLGHDTVLCSPDILVLHVNGNFTSEVWQDGTTGPVYTVNQSGLYYVNVTNASGCTVADSIVVTVHTPSVELGNDTTLCNAGILVLHASGNFVYAVWADGTMGNYYTVNRAGEYIVTVLDSFGCKAKDTMAVSYYPSIQLDSLTGGRLCDSTVVISVDGSFSRYLWSTGATTPSIAVAAIGQFFVTVTDNNGCTASDSVAVLTCDTLGIRSDYFIPNAFTPNGDGQNDLFGMFRKPNVEPAQFFLMTIYNRVGERVFETTSESATWDGTYKGKLLPSGVYVYLIKYSGMSDHVTIKGAVTLLR